MKIYSEKAHHIYWLSQFIVSSIIFKAKQYKAASQVTEENNLIQIQPITGKVKFRLLKTLIEN